MKKALKVSEDHESGMEAPSESSKVPWGRGRGKLKSPRVLEALSTTRLRAIRYAREVEGLVQFVALDNDKGWSWNIFHLWKRAGETLNSMVQLQVQRWNQTLSMLEYICLQLTHPKEFDMDIMFLRLILILMAHHLCSWTLRFTLFDSGSDVDICGMTSCVSVSVAGMLILEEAISSVQTDLLDEEKENVEEDLVIAMLYDEYVVASGTGIINELSMPIRQRIHPE
ncbi:N2,N2-dimethylguanosine tRNA methyltransferase [Artemisia annua]|uniref:N2,N2-dimethylguanosine tRNA methyltransferase n=1 Tax=Artemisia annua TaxID=35608 RepID=A0A2U1MB49_ARTAN|nr:N2,N2-dimethylguanosine tRNA methyltransferase [Artemisia annua]